MPEFAHAPQPQHHPAAEPATHPAPTPAPLPAASLAIRNTQHSALSTQHSPAGHDFGRMAVHAPEPGHLQAKLVTNAPGDSYEQDADRLAAQVTATPGPPAASAPPPRIRRLTEPPGGPGAPPSVGAALTGPGTPLDPALRRDMEGRFGYDFSRVRVHTGAAAAQSARDLHALAYTTGPHLVFAAGQYAPETPPGRRLLAHELAHVAQQAAAAPLPAQAGPGPAPVAAPGPAPASGVVQRAPDPAPQADPQHPFLLKYQGRPDKDRWINLEDVEWSENYIDFNMITMQVTFIPGTNLDNIDHDRAKAIHIEYANGHIVDLPMDAIPLIKDPNPRGARVGRLDYYEMRDGMIYPIASGMVMYSPQNTPNLIGLRYDAYNRIEQLRQLAVLRSLAGTFANLIAMSVGVMGSVHEMGGMGGVPGGGGRPRRGGTQTDPPDIGREIDEAFRRLPEEDPHSGAVRDPNSPIRSDVMVGGQPEAVGPSKGGVPAVKDPKAPPPELLDVGAGPQRTNLGVPPEHELVAVTRSDVSPAGNPDVVLDATKPIPANLRGRFTTLMVNNPYGYKPNIGAMREALGPDGKIIVQGNWEANKYFRSLGTDAVPPGMTRTIERDLPPSAILGGGFRTTSGERPVQPNARITFHVSH